MPDLPTPLLAACRSVKNIAVVRVIAKLKKPVAKNFWLGTNDPKMDILGLGEYTMRGLCVADTSYYYPEDRGISESIAFGRNVARMATA